MGRYIFLDIDGVMNCQDYYTKGRSHTQYPLSEICPERVQLLNRFVEETGARVVLSSSWRHGRTLVEMNNIFSELGATFHIIDFTPTLDMRFKGAVRGNEIALWIEENIKDRFNFKSLWMWVTPVHADIISIDVGVYYHEIATDIVNDNEGDKFDMQKSSAFTVAELGELLPDGFELNKCPNIAQFRSFRISKIALSKRGVLPGYKCSADFAAVKGVVAGCDAYEVWHSEYGETEAQARAAMLIYLIENGHYAPTVQECDATSA